VLVLGLNAKSLCFTSLAPRASITVGVSPLNTKLNARIFDVHGEWNICGGAYVEGSSLFSLFLFSINKLFLK